MSSRSGNTQFAGDGNLPAGKTNTIDSQAKTGDYMTKKRKRAAFQAVCISGTPVLLVLLLLLPPELQIAKVALMTCSLPALYIGFMRLVMHMHRKRRLHFGTASHLKAFGETLAEYLFIVRWYLGGVVCSTMLTVVLLASGSWPLTAIVALPALALGLASAYLFQERIEYPLWERAMEDMRRTYALPQTM
jgi:hypothetical protein